MHPGYPHPFKKMYDHQLRQFKRLPLRISQWALLEMKENFQRGGYYDESGRFIKWKPRSKNKLWAKKSNDEGRALLILTSRLRRSLKAAPLYMMARVVTDVPYAETHQKGFKGTISQKVKAFMRRKKGTGGKVGGRDKMGRYIKGSGGKTAGTIKVKGHNRKIKVNIPKRPFLEAGKPFFDKMERTILTELDQLFLNS